MAELSKISEHMEVVDPNGQHVGTVDHMDGRDKIKLTMNDPASQGRHHYIPCDWVTAVDDRVHLSKSSSELFEMWKM